MKRENVPNKPGCYLFLDKDGKIIYIGKAKDLKKRTSSYFQKKHTDEKTQHLMDKIHDLKFIVTDSEVEALILENNLIKKHQPKYNINLKDDKRYAYIRITDEKFPRLVIARDKSEPGKYFGPFVSAETRDYVLNTVTKAFQIRTCRRMPKKECLRYHLNICSAPCIGKISAKEYDESLSNAFLVMKGKTDFLSKRLKVRMRRASDNLDFEFAMELRNQLRAIDWLKTKQNMERDKSHDEDIINYVKTEDKIYLILFNISKGIFLNKQEYEFDVQEDFLEQFLTQFYSENNIPKEIIIPHTVDPVISDFLSRIKGKKVRLVVPKLGEKRKLLRLVKENVQNTFFGDQEKLEDLKIRLKLNELPEIIECFDISHLSGTDTVASMVRFYRSKPDKNNYRRFKIRSVDGIDDFKSIAEVVRRRYTRLLKEGATLPNLVVIDGGKGQLHSALKELSDLGLNIPTISLAKRFEEIFVPGLRRPLKVGKQTKALKLLQEIRDEAHRFAIKYNRLLRKKRIK